MDIERLLAVDDATDAAIGDMERLYLPDRVRAVKTPRLAVDLQTALLNLEMYDSAKFAV
jgi:hypothetical protein